MTSGLTTRASASSSASEASASVACCQFNSAYKYPAGLRAKYVFIYVYLCVYIYTHTHIYIYLFVPVCCLCTPSYSCCNVSSTQRMLVYGTAVLQRGKRSICNGTAFSVLQCTMSGSRAAALQHGQVARCMFTTLSAQLVRVSAAT